MKKCRWAIFVSGQGSNLAALIGLRAEHPEAVTHIELSLVVSSNPQAPALDKAQKAGIKTIVLAEKINWSQVEEDLNSNGITHIFLLGFMKIIPKSFLEKWKKPILNVHPSLLPAYPGLRSIDRALEDGAPLGVTVHHVTAEVDAGEIVLQKQVYSAHQADGLSRQVIEMNMHLAEYEIVKKSFLAVSC